MADVEFSTAPATTPCVNVTARLTEFAARMPENLAVAAARRGSAQYDTITFGELDADATRIAQGLVDWGVRPGTRLALLVRPGIEFVTLVFALLRAGVVIVLVDPGLGRGNLVRCLADAEPEGFVAVPLAQAARLWHREKFPKATWNVTVGRRWFWGGLTLDDFRQMGANGSASASPVTVANDPAAIIFTSGSTGPPKGVHYTHEMFDTQVAEIQSIYGIEPGRVDLSCFPLFALFNSAMGVTTVLPDMDFSRPASADPAKLVAAANEWKVSQAFASPAVWRSLSAHCKATGERIGTLREIFSCGAPVPADVLRSTIAIAAPNARMHTPYGATECLPVATIEAAEVLDETAARTDAGAGICVGRPFDTIEWKIIRITDEPIAAIFDAEELPPGEIGELIVRGSQASPRYVTQSEINAVAKIADTVGQWHRMGDVGYLDSTDRFWYCGRKSHRVETATGPLFTECVEAIFNTHPAVSRSALVGIGAKGQQKAVIICQPIPNVTYCNGRPVAKNPDHRIIRELREFAERYPLTRGIDHFLIRGELPVDIRHNAKINREQLAQWAAAKLPELA